MCKAREWPAVSLFWHSSYCYDSPIREGILRVSPQTSSCMPCPPFRRVLAGFQRLSQRSFEAAK